MNDPQNSENQEITDTESKKAGMPASEKQIFALEKFITNKILQYKEKRTINKRLAITARTLIVLFSFSTTVAIGFKLNNKSVDDDMVKINIALIFSTLVTAISSLEKFFDYKPLWIGYNISIASLNSLLAELNYKTSCCTEKITKEQIDDIFKKFSTICENLDQNYREIRSARDE